jgi:hypothetical protein
MYGVAYSNFMDYMTKDDGFAGGTSEAGAVIVATIVILLLLVVQLYIVQWLWNNILVRVVTFAKPIPSLAYTLGLLVLVLMVFPGSAA